MYFWKKKEKVQTSIFNQIIKNVKSDTFARFINHINLLSKNILLDYKMEKDCCDYWFTHLHSYILLVQNLKFTNNILNLYKR